MPSQLVTGVRALIAERTDAGHPLTNLERTFILSAIAPRTRDSDDVVDELEAAIVEARRILLTNPPRGSDPSIVDARRRQTARRLIAAARAAIDYDPFTEYDPTATAPTERARPERADVDG